MSEFIHDDGNWYGLTIGEFIQILIDSGHDPAIMFRVESDTEPDSKGRFVRHMEVISLPDGLVFDNLHKKCKAVTPLLQTLIDKEKIT